MSALRVARRPVETPASLVELEALRYAERGWAVIAVHGILRACCTCRSDGCNSPGKHPRTKNGVLDATTDGVVVKEMWARWPRANVGIATGVSSGLLVIDIDPDHGGAESLRKLWQEVGEFETMTVATGGGGQHFYFSYEGADIRNSAGKLGNGIDVRGDGGYVVAPPSVHISGGRYEVTLDIAPLPLEGKLLGMLRQLGAVPSRAGSARGQRTTRRSRLAEPDRNAASIEEGTRNDKLTSLAGSLRRAGLSQDAALEAVGVENRKRCRPPLDDAELEGIIDSIWRYPVSVPDGEAEEVGGRESVATKLVNIFDENYRGGQDMDGNAFAVSKNGANVALGLRGGGQLRQELAATYFDRFDKAATSSALTDALAVIEGRALRQEREAVHLRFANHASDTVLDLGGSAGQCVVVNSQGWRIMDRSPVLFRRTALTGELPHPRPGAGLDQLRQLLNVDEMNWRQLVGALVAAFFLDCPHVIVLLSGEHGTAKSSTARLLVRVLDPAPAELRSPPRNLDDWIVAAGASHVVCIDNVSYIPEWFSDALCRAATGEALVKRRLYTDSDVAILNFRRCIFLTAIDPGALRGDLADRLLMVELSRIPEDQRLMDADITRQFREVWPDVLGGLLDLVSRVMGVLPELKLERLPRMADHAHVLAAIDHVCGWSALEDFVDQRGQLSAAVVDDDVIGSHIRGLVEHRPWRGKPTDLLAALNESLGDSRRPRGWPDTASQTSQKLKRLIPALRALGIDVEFTRNSGARSIRIFKALSDDDGADAPSLASSSSSGSRRGKRTAGLSTRKRPKGVYEQTVGDQLTWDDELQ